MTYYDDESDLLLRVSIKMKVYKFGKAIYFIWKELLNALQVIAMAQVKTKSFKWDVSKARQVK